MPYIYLVLQLIHVFYSSPYKQRGELEYLYSRLAITDSIQVLHQIKIYRPSKWAPWRPCL